MKKIPLSSSTFSEVDVLKALVKSPSPFILTTVDMFTSKDSADRPMLCVVRELTNTTTFYNMLHTFHLKLCKPPPMIFIKYYTYQLLRALSHLHGLGIVHRLLFPLLLSLLSFMCFLMSLFFDRNIRPSGIFVDTATHLVKLGDFECAGHVDIHKEVNDFLHVDAYYCAPELLSDLYLVNPSMDMWSVGIVVVQFVTGDVPFEGTSLETFMINVKEVGNCTYVPVFHFIYVSVSIFVSIGRTCC